MITPSLHEIQPCTILPNSFMGFNVYLSNGKGERPVKFLSSHIQIADADCQQLRENAERQVFIEATSLGAYREYLASHSSQWLTDDRLSATTKTSLLLECMLAKWEVAYASHDLQTTIDLARDISLRLASAISLIGIRIPDVLKSLDSSTDLVRHTLRTAVYGIQLADAMGYDRSGLAEICMGGLLHDIGKQASGQPVASSGPNDRLARTHPLMGFRRLCVCPNISKTVLMMCYQHHEHMDGSGFPVRLVEQEIHFGARICAIVNRFDHLTTNENPRIAYTPGSAGRIMEQDRSQRFDQEMMRTWLKLLKNHLRNN